ncbi:flagellar basal body-associated FliL family protein [Algicella marina]|uniref:Flagellar protein FliL n=1 Tax=Algicella marina TaxID=2683284 RepID=A0A6P1T5S5_9RHOB|nr:flagellar basal body-associated FliL family protein [Algicella marina]QHQ36806.1 flagellar basal body protein FliL [Algicella marina]
MAEITDPDAEAQEQPPKSGLKGLVVALVGAVVAGGIGFGASYAGLLDGLLGGGADSHVVVMETDHEFVPLEPIIVSLGPRARAGSLKFTAQLEVESDYTENVVSMIPRIQDVLNTFLRAVEESELEDPGALPLLRAQMLRRIQIVLGEGQVRDLLITEFILN